MSKGSPKYNHAEAFCLMTYRCDSCLHLETFWNSRDGVTPFVVIARCRRCEGDMQHINFRSDVCAPDHIPFRGQGIFIDMPESLKRTVALLRVKRGVEAGYPTPDPDGIVEEMITGFHVGEPWFTRW